MSHPLLPVGTPTINGRIYPNDVAQDIVEKINSSDMFVTADTPETAYVPLERVAGYARNAKVEDGWVVIDFEPVKTAHGSIITTLMDNKVKLDFVTCGTGTVHPDGTISDYEIFCVAAVPAQHYKLGKP
jgi:hypothetical protein